MMAINRTKLATAAILAAVGASGGAEAQQTASLTPQAEIDRLEALSAQRNASMHHAPMSAPRANTRTVLRQPDHLWVCMSTTPWQPVYSSPDYRSPPIGQTTSQVAVNGGWINGFAQVLHYNGKIGFIPANSARPYSNPVKPNGSCSIAGVKPDGSPVFALR